MVYNAMKMFMEINPDLFRICTEQHEHMLKTAEERQQARKSKWDQLAQQANRRRNGQSQATIPVTDPVGQKALAPVRTDEVDPITQDSQKRLDALRLQDEGANPQKAAVLEPFQP